MTDFSFQLSLKRELFTGHDGSMRLTIHLGEGEFVCAACDVIVIGTRPPTRCAACRSDRIETLTAIVRSPLPLKAVVMGASHDPGF